LLALAAVVVLSVVVLPGRAEAKSYYVSQVRIEAEIQPDGSMNVVEQRTFAFDGSFTFVVQDLVWSGSQGITDIVVSEGGQPYTRAASGNKVYSYKTTGPSRIEVTWRFAANSERRTFEISYRVLGAVLAHQDVGELYWKFIGDEWDVRQEDILVQLELPEGAAAGDVRAWGHGPLAGEVKIVSPTRVTWTLGRLPAKKFLEGRVTFPTRLVPEATRRSTAPGLPGILKEEEALARRANLDRLKDLGSVLFGIVVLSGSLAGALFLQARHGREYRPQFEGDYYRELPGDYTPAELGSLWRFGPVGAPEISATILDLARKGYLAIEVVTEDRKVLGGLLGSRQDTGYRIKLLKGDWGGLAEHERAVLELLFRMVAPGSDVMDFESIKGWAKGRPASMQEWIKKFEGMVRGTDAVDSFFDHRTETIRMYEISAGVLILLGGMALFVQGMLVGGIAATIGGVVLVLGGAGLRRRSQEGSTHLAMWRGFRRFLLHFSSLDRAEVPSLIIWEHYLVFAVVLGVAKEVLEQLRIVFPQISEARPGYYPWAWMHFAGARGAASPVAMVSGLTDALHSSVATAVNYRPSSGGGRGGGFSGGGFGGGGGGGGGGGRAG
jgi:uncharacterized membrane protein